MLDEFIFLNHIDVIDELFTKSILTEWRNNLIQAYKIVRSEIAEKFDSSFPLKFFISKSLLEDVIVDAVMGLKKIVNSPYNSVRFPNTFKIASHLSYWWLRHKPVSLYYPKGYYLEYIVLAENEYADEEKARKELVWNLKHINELIAVHLCVSYIFDTTDVVCNEKQCKKLKRADNNFKFDDFEDMTAIMLQKLTYYFSYRPITTEVIEHILEGYTLHPIWKLTGPLWAK